MIRRTIVPASSTVRRNRHLEFSGAGGVANAHVVSGIETSIIPENTDNRLVRAARANKTVTHASALVDQVVPVNAVVAVVNDLCTKPPISPTADTLKAKR